MMVTLSEKPLSATIRLAWSAIAEHSIPYTCFAPDCNNTIQGDVLSKAAPEVFVLYHADELISDL